MASQSPIRRTRLQQLILANIKKNIVHCERNPTMAGGFPPQRASNVEASPCHDVIMSFPHHKPFLVKRKEHTLYVRSFFLISPCFRIAECVPCEKLERRKLCKLCRTSWWNGEVGSPTGSWANCTAVKWIPLGTSLRCDLTHWGRNKTDAILQTTYSNVFSKWKLLIFN